MSENSELANTIEEPATLDDVLNAVAAIGEILQQRVNDLTELVQELEEKIDELQDELEELGGIVGYQNPEDE